ncbi:MAG: DUF5362 family protein [Flavobacteriales bacterium]
MENNQIIVSEQSKEFLLETAKWARFLSIVSFVALGIMALVGVSVSFSAFLFSNETNPSNAAFAPALGILYIALGAVYFFPTIYLFRFSSQLKSAILEVDSETLESGFENLKSLFRFTGILTIVTLSFYALSILLVIVSVLLK